MAHPDTNPRVLVAIPALNEARSVGRVVAELRTHHPDAELLVIDDGSRDGTAGVARAAGARVCKIPFNLGVGGAMRVAYKYAQRNDFDVVVQVDADGQHDPRHLSDLVAGLAEADLVIGARFSGGGAYKVTAMRRLAMHVLALVLSGIAGARLTDVTSGFRACNRKAINVFALHYPSEYLGDTVESLVIALRTGCAVRQIPVHMRYRTTGAASQSVMRATVYLIRAFAALLLALVRSWPTPEIEDAASQEHLNEEEPSCAQT